MSGAQRRDPARNREMGARTVGASPKRTVAHEPSMATIDLGNRGLSDGDALDTYIDEYIDGAVGDTIQIPAGEYPVNDGHIDMPIDGVTVEGIGGEVVWDMGHNHSHQIGFHALSDSTVRDQTFAGQAASGSTVPVWANSGAELRFENCRWPDGSENDNNNGLYVRAQGGDRTHQGVLRFENCEVRGFADNAIYASAPGADGGPVYVENCEFYNNNIAAVRLGGDGSYVRDSYIEVTDSETPQTGSGKNARGVWIRASGNYTIENCEFVYDSSYNPIITRHTAASGSTTEVRNCRIVQNGSGSLINEGQGDIVGGGNHGTGPSTDAEHVFACLNNDCQQPGDVDDPGGTGDHTLEVQAGSSVGQDVEYSVTTTGQLYAGPAAEESDTIAENSDGTWTVSGLVTGGYEDSFTADGQVDSLDVPDGVTVLVDGSAVADPGDGNGDGDGDGDDENGDGETPADAGTPLLAIGLLGAALARAARRGERE